MYRTQFLYFLIFLCFGFIFSTNANPKQIKISIQEDGVVVGNQKLSPGLKIEDYEPIFGAYDVKENREDGLYYTWDKLGIKVREDKSTLTINQLSIYLVVSRASDTKKAFSGVVNVLGKDVNAKVTPAKFSNDIICQQIFCTFKSEVANVNVNLTEDKRNFKLILAKIE